MKRLLAQIGIIYFSVLAVAFYLPERAEWILLIGAVVLSVILLLIRRSRRCVWLPAVALTAAAALAMNLGFTYLSVIPIQDRFTGSDKRIEATLTDEAYRAYSKYYYRLRVDAIDGADTDTKLLLMTNRPIDIEPFDTITFSADIDRTENQYYLSKGYFLSVNTFDDSFEVIAASDRPLYYRVIQLRRSLRAAFDEFLPEDAAALCKAVFIGDKYALDTDTKADFRYAGASYFIVVSGMHFSVIILLLYRLLERLRMNRFVRLAVVLPLIVLYMCVTGFQPSVVRSGVMMTVYVIARAIRRVNDPHTSLGLAGIVSAVVFSPYGAGDIGLILSFAATFAIVTWSEPICRRLSFRNPDSVPKRTVNAVIQVMSASLAANLLVFPISVFVFNAFSSVTLLSAFLLYIPIELILVLSLFVCVFFYLGPLRYLSLLLSWGLYGLSRFVLWTVGGLASLPFSYIHISHDFFYIWLSITLVMALVVILLRRRVRLLPFAAILSAIILLGGTIACAFVDLNTTRIRAFSCGEGLTVGLELHGNLYMLSFDAKSYDAYRILDDLSLRYGEAQLAVCSKKHDLTNYSRLSDKEFAIRRYLLYDSDVRYEGSAELIAHDSADVYLLDDDVTLTLAQRYGKLLSYLTVGDTTVLVIPPGFPLKNIPAEYRSADIIVMSRMAEGYEALSCDTLIVSNDADHVQDIYDSMKDRCRTMTDTAGGDVTIRLG